MVMEENGKELEIARHSFPYGMVSESGLFFITYTKTSIFRNACSAAGTVRPGMDYTTVLWASPGPSPVRRFCSLSASIEIARGKLLARCNGCIPITPAKTGIQPRSPLDFGWNLS